MGIAKHDLEGRLLALEFDTFFLLTIYAPNVGWNQSRVDYRTKEWDHDLILYMHSLKSESQKSIILCGDLNSAHRQIDIYPRKTYVVSAKETTWFEKILDSGLTDSFRALHPDKIKYTWWA